MTEPILATLTMAAFARVHGVAKPTVTGWRRRGYLAMTVDGLVDVAASNARLAARPLGKTKLGRDLKAGGEAVALSGAAERARLAKAQADAQELKNAVTRGELLDASEVEREWTATFAAVRAGVLAASSRVAQRLPQLSLHDISEIDAELRAVLTELGGGR
jgi:phage terminase Nu1 subunit (DNA packaging protein)